MSKGGGKFGGTFGDDAVSAMKNWASRLEAEETASRMWYKDWGFLASGDPNDRKVKIFRDGWQLYRKS